MFPSDLNVLPAASKTTAKCVGGGSSSRSPSKVRRKAKRMDVSSPVLVARRTSFSPKCARYSRAKASKSMSLQQHPALDKTSSRLSVTPPVAGKQWDTCACTVLYLPPVADVELLFCVAAVTYDGDVLLTQLCDPCFKQDCAAEVVACEWDALRST